MGFRIDLDLAPELSTTWDLSNPDKVAMKIVGDSTMSVQNDGLYVSARPGQDGTGGTGFDDYYTNEGIRLGYSNPYSDIIAARRVTGMHYVHRLYDATMSTASIPTGYTRLDNLGNLGWNYVESGYVPTRYDTFESEIMFWDDGHTDFSNHSRYARFLFGTFSSSAWNDQTEWNCDGLAYFDRGGGGYQYYSRNPSMVYIYHLAETATPAYSMNIHERDHYVWELLRVSTAGTEDDLLHDVISFYDPETGDFKAGDNGVRQTGDNEELNREQEEDIRSHFWSSGDSPYQMYIFYCNFGDAGYVPCKQGSHSEYPWIYNHICAKCCSMRHFAVKDTITGKIKRYYVPCERDSDGKAGMFELVTQTFYEEKGLENCHFEKIRVGVDTPDLPTIDGTLTPLNFRSEIDYVLVGDMCRVDQGNGTYKYYLVTGTSSNTITSYEELGVW